jgi:hypothetical protein
MGHISTRMQIWLVLFLTLPAIGLRQPPQISTAREYQLKAAFLFNFTQFVEWPSESLSEPSTPLVIGILGEDPFGSYLDEIVANEKIDTHPLEIRRFRAESDVTQCHILFINLKGNAAQSEVFTSLKRKSILTVGDTDRFIRNGGMIRFVNENNKIRIRIDLEATKQAGLTISPKLLRLAEITSSSNN